MAVLHAAGLGDATTARDVAEAVYRAATHLDCLVVLPAGLMQLSRQVAGSASFRGYFRFFETRRPFTGQNAGNWAKVGFFGFVNAAPVLELAEQTFDEIAPAVFRAILRIGTRRLLLARWTASTPAAASSARMAWAS